MMRQRTLIAAVLAALLVGLVGFLPAQKAQAATWYCTNWVSTYQGGLGVTVYRGSVLCSGNIPGTQYRAKIRCSIWPLGVGKTIYGKWKTEGSYVVSRNSCPWPWYIDGRADVIVQRR